MAALTKKKRPALIQEVLEVYPNKQEKIVLNIWMKINP
jgi:hypothetical protein